MPRGNKNDDYRARGGSHGRSGRPYSRGRGGQSPNQAVPIAAAAPATTAANRVPHNLYPHASAEIDVVVQQWPKPGPGTNGGGNLNREYGPWRGGTPWRGTDSSRRGASRPRGRGAGRARGRGRGSDGGRDTLNPPRRPRLGVGGKVKAMIGKSAPLSDLLYSERPLLRPVKFVRATLTPFLFQHPEDVLKPAVEITDTEESHVLTAGRVAQLFRESETGTGTTSDSGLESEDRTQDALEEIDFADMAQFCAEVDAIAQSMGTEMMTRNVHRDNEDIEEVDFADLASICAKIDATRPKAASQDDIIQETFTGAYNQIKDMTQVSSASHIVDDRRPGVPLAASLSVSSTLNDTLHLKPFASIDISNAFHHESLTQTQNTFVIEQGPPNVLLNPPVEDQSLYTQPKEIRPTIFIDDIPLDSSSLSHDEPNPLFVIDTAPTRHFAGSSASDAILVDRTGHGETLGDQDEERIIYVAPYPRSWRTSGSPVPVIPRVKLPQSSMLTGRPIDSEVGGLRSPVREDDDGVTTSNRDGMRPVLEAEAGEEPYLSLAPPSLEPPTDSASALASTTQPCWPTRTNVALRARKEAWLRRKRERQNKRGRLGFGAFGAMMSEARLREEDARERRRPRWETRRKGDSDVDWGTEDEDEDKRGAGRVDDEVDALSDGLGGMQIDPDLEMDVDAMRGFLKSMSVEGTRFVTMNDIEGEDQVGPDGSTDSEGDDEEQEEEEVFNVEEQLLIAESEDDKGLSEDSDDDDELSPRSSFQARLSKLREQSRAKPPQTLQEISDDEEEEDAPEFLRRTHCADDEEFIAHIHCLLEENSEILSGRNRKQKKAVFRDLHRGYVDEWDVEALLDDPEFTTPVNKKKGKKDKGKQSTAGYFDAKMEAQWAKDRAKKAARKQERRAGQLLAALDPLSAGNGHTSRKAMRAAARLGPNAMLAVAPLAIIDMASLEAQMRRFAMDRAGRTSMALPPMDREMRKMVHEVAAAFGVKSVSKGNGTGRYTTLIRTSRTGVSVNEVKVKKLVKRFGRKDGCGRGGRGGQMPGHREGDEVGKGASKIGESNIGFKMLASMGWSEGDRIGGTASVGIEAPLTAIIKHTKLGLGATR